MMIPAAMTEKHVVRVEDEYPDVLQNIELAVVITWRENPDMSDYDVMHVLETLIDDYKGENIGRPPRPVHLSEVERQLLSNMRGMCEWRLGRSQMTTESVALVIPGMTPVTIDEIILCLKRLQKSVRRWNSAGGRQAYLRFIAEFAR